MDDKLGEQLVDVKHVANYLGVDRITIYRWCKHGQIPHVRLPNRTIKFEPQVIKDIVANGGQVNKPVKGVADAGRAVQR